MLLIVMGGIGYMFYPEQQVVQKQKETPQTESLEKVFYERLNKTGDPVKAINKLIDEYGEGVLDVLAKEWDIPGLQKKDFDFGRDYDKEYEDNAKLREKAPGIALPEDDTYESLQRTVTLMDKFKANDYPVNPMAEKKQKLSVKRMKEN